MMGSEIAKEEELRVKEEMAGLEDDRRKSARVGNSSVIDVTRPTSPIPHFTLITR